MVYAIIVSIHVVASIVLIAVILLQAGRGGGLSESFGGSSTQTIFGTKASTFLVRATAICAVTYIITCMTLAVMTTHRGRSLMATQRLRAGAPAGLPIVPGKAGVPLTMPGMPPTTPVTGPSGEAAATGKADAAQAKPKEGPPLSVPINPFEEY